MDFATVDTADGFEVTSNTATEADLRTQLTPGPDDFTVETTDDEKPKADGKAAKPAVDDADEDKASERNPDGTFKGKEAKPEAKAKPRNDPHARVEQATAKEAAAKRERDEARAEAATLRAELERHRAPKPEQRQPAPVVASADSGEPNPDDTTKYPDGQFDRKYIKDQARYEAEQVIEKREAASREREETDRTAQRVYEHETKFRERLSKADPELFQKLSPPMQAFLQHATPTAKLPKGQPIAFVNVMADVFMRSEKPDALMQHFSDVPQDLQRLSTLHPAEFYRELGKLEAHLTAATTSGPASGATVISQAKPLIKPVSAAPSASGDDPPGDDEDFDAFARYWNRKSANGGRR